MVMELFRNQNFTLTAGDSKQSRLPCIKAAFYMDLFWLPSFSTSICTTGPLRFPKNLPKETISALLHSSENWKTFFGNFKSRYLQIWKLKLSHTNDIHTMMRNSFFSVCFFIKRTPTEASALVRLTACSFGRLSRQKIH